MINRKVILAALSLLAAVLLGVLNGLLLDGVMMYAVSFLITFAWGFFVSRLYGDPGRSEY